jgi:hypothetical protein
LSGLDVQGSFGKRVVITGGSLELVSQWWKLSLDAGRGAPRLRAVPGRSLPPRASAAPEYVGDAGNCALMDRIVADEQAVVLTFNAGSRVPMSLIRPADRALEHAAQPSESFSHREW